MDPVVHFEMPYDDRARMAKFYQAAFGWKMKMLGEQMGNYVVAATSAAGPDGTPKKQGMINGGFYARTGGPDQYPSVVIAVKDVKRAMESVRSAGGEVLGDPMTIPGIGEYVSIKDSEGNRVGMLQPMPMPAKAKAKKKASARKPAAKRAASKKKRANAAK